MILFIAAFPMATYAAKTPNVSYSVSLNGSSWKSTVKNGKTSGSTKSNKDLKAIKITLQNKKQSQIKYRVYNEDTGWQSWKTSGEATSTTKSVDSVQVKLTGKYAKKYDVYYRVHTSAYGWLGWAKNGKQAGTSGGSTNMAALQVKLVKKGSKVATGGSAYLDTSADINDSSVFFKQSMGGTCTLASAAMMLRRKAMLNGSSSWKTVTEGNVRGRAWTYAGLSWTFSYAGMNVKHISLSGTAAAKTSKIRTYLAAHPEGIVIYDTKHSPHAVLLTDYTDGKFYCADPANGIASGRIPLDQSLIAKRTGSSNHVTILGSITAIWYVSN